MDKERLIEIPKRVKVGPYTYQVVTPTDTLDDLGRYGDVRHRKCEIRVDATQIIPLVRTTLLHEVLHAITDVFLPTEDQLSDKHVHALVYALLLFAADNPEAMSYIFDGDIRHTDHRPS